MIAVLIIMSIMMGLAVLGVQNISTHMAVRHGAQGIQAAAGAARQHAITTSIRTYVLFLGLGTDFTGIEDLKPLAGRGYAVYARDQGTGRSYFLTEWRSLPEGVIFDASHGAANSVFASSSASRAVNVPIKRDDYEGSDAYRELTLDAVRFRPTGATYSRAGYTVPVTEGWVDVDVETGNLIVIPKPSSLAARVVVRGLTGYAQVEIP